MRLILTEGTLADCTQALTLTADLQAQHLLAHRGYETNSIVTGAMAQGMGPVIPPRRHRKAPRFYDQDLYRLRHLVEIPFLNLKHWRRWQLAAPKGPSHISLFARVERWYSRPNYSYDTA